VSLPPLDPERIARDILEYSRKLGDGLGHLRNAGRVEVGQTPRDAVHHDDKVTLYRYRAGDGPAAGPPLLIVYALVNRPYMMDLQPDRSLIRRLLDEGVDVWLIDWGYPDASDRGLGLDDYVLGYLDRCVERVCESRASDAVNVLGVCQGGSLSLCYAALRPERVRTLVTMVTPVDFHTEDNLLGRWVRHVDVDALVDTLGNVPGELLNWTFLSLKPYRLGAQKYVDMVDHLDDVGRLENFMRMEKWIFDSPDQAGEAFRQFIKGFFQDNGLVRGTLSIGGRAVDLGAVRQPLLNIYADADHLVPPAASRALGDHVGSDDYTEIAFAGGHIGIYVSGRAQREVPTAIAAWLRERQPESGITRTRKKRATRSK
jgi:polyhydroxyalkanoate synthase